jgi:nicotinamidase-related amidase
MKKILIVIDMQNFFITGSMGTPEGLAIVPRIIDKLHAFDGPVYVTQDVNPSCAEGSESFANYPPIQAALPERAMYFTKWTFGSADLAKAVSDEYGELNTLDAEGNPLLEIEFCGVCTSVCVISNALMMKAFLPKARIKVDSSCCAGHTPELHDAALKVMKNCRIEVV